MLGIKWLENGDDKWSSFQTEALPYSKDLYRVAMWMTRNPTEAEDLVQETMFQAMRSFHGYTLGTNCRAWLMTIMHNTNAKRIKGLARLSLVADTEDRIAETIPFEPSIPESITDEEVLDAIQNIPEHFRNVLVLADIEEFSYKEISTILDLPLGTVMSRLHRARRILRLGLADYARDFGFGENRQAAGN